MSTDQVLAGVGLIVVLAVGSQVLASRLRIPALIILLPAGFTAGALTTDVNPQRLLGAAFQPLVSIAVAVILYDSGLALEWGKVSGRARRVVPRLVIWGVPVTMAFAAVLAGPLLGMSAGAAVMTGAILVVSGPTVVGPLLAFVRPSDRLQRILSWEGSLIDPVGGILGAVVFHAVLASTSGGLGHPLGQFLLSVGVGAVGAAVGVAVLWLCLCKLDLDEVLGTASQLACVIGVAAACDVVRDDAGLIATVLMGLAVTNLRAFDIPARRPFFETLVQLIIGVLFVSISATVTPESLSHLVLPTLGLVAVLVLVTRPLVAFAATIGTELTRGERAFTGWMAPRGIVAAATASTFGAELAAHHIGGASKILPVAFLVIVVTVALYGLTAVPVARRLGVTRPARSRPLLVGSDPWVIDLARAFGTSGLDVLMWAPTDRQRTQLKQAALELAPGEQISTAVTHGTAIEGVTAVFLLTDEDHYNALAATTLAGSSDTPVYWVAPSSGGPPPSIAGEPLFAPTFTHPSLTARYAAGARITTQSSDGGIPSATDLLFLINPEGTLIPVTTSCPPDPQPGDTLVLLGPGVNRTPQYPPALPSGFTQKRGMPRVRQAARVGLRVRATTCGRAHREADRMASKKGTGTSPASAPPEKMTRAGFQQLYDQLRSRPPWGPADRGGALNYLTPATTLAAVGAVKLGRSVSLAGPIEYRVTADNPKPARHKMTQTGDTAPSGGLSFAMDQIGMNIHGDADTHIDALSHVIYDGRLYNNRPADIVSDTGAAELSIAAAANGIVGRGVLLDVPRSRGVPWLEPGDQVTADDLAAAGRDQQVEVGEGDLVFIRVGHRLRRFQLGPWDAADARAGLHPAVMEYLADRKIALLGSDGNNDTAPSLVPGVDFPVHVLAIAALGLHLIDYLDLDGVAPICAEFRQWSFLCVVAPLRLALATGSPVNPIAIL